MEITTDLTLDLKRPNINTIVHAKQNDRLSRFLNAELMDGAQEWNLPQNVMFTIRYKKADGTRGFYDVDEDGNAAVEVISGNKVKITLAEQAISAPGHVLMELNMYNGSGEKLTTFIWIVLVEESALPDEEIESTDYFNILTRQITEVLGKIDAVAGITAQAHSIPYGDETYVVVTGGTGREDPYLLDFYIESARPMNPRGNYSASETYNRLDFVIYSGSSYVAMRDGVKNIIPGSSTEDWQMLASSVTVSAQDIKYASQTENQYTGEPPASGWQSEIPILFASGFLWTRIVTTYSDNTSFTSFSVSRNGANGGGSVSVEGETLIFTDPV